MLFVVAWPLLAEADDIALRRLRAQYHPGEADLIGPHFTLVFGAAPGEEERLRALLADLARRRPFWFMLDRLVRHDLAPPSRAAYLFATPADGAAELIELHETLNPEPAREAFEPHITVGLFDHAAAAEQVARIVERQHLPMHGRVEELALLRRDGGALETLQAVRLVQ
ncbi:MAG: 2'-5' RNA ligase family protein [Reyranella sp.]|uniref:2'-5' RNA ligase family protein n=1 Tax=Reyranella sp. TaxID=1929291 RepID=UPI003D0B96DE